jgi:hypothetical protein
LDLLSAGAHAALRSPSKLILDELEKIDMFRSAPVAEPAPEMGNIFPTSEPPIPLTHLALDLPEPPIGWVAYLNNIGVEVVEDGIGRSAVSSVDARMLIAEYRAAEAVKAEMRARQEREAIESDRHWRAQLPHGLPWYDIPDGVLPVVAMTQAARDAQPKRLSPLQEALSQSSMTFHSFAPTSDEE